jgi:tetratricopeptide (TPR) repeat protein
MHTENFRAYSTAGARATRDTLRHFEQVRAFFLTMLGSDPKRFPPVQLVLFGSRKDYEPYRVNEGAIAYYRPGADQDFIVMGEVGAETFPIAVHEYFHLVAKTSGTGLPAWLNEGMAEVYSTLQPRGDKILVGSLIAGRHQALLMDKWVPLSTILSVDHDSPYYNEKAKMGSFYNESWALTHMLALSDAYRPKFVKLLQAATAGPVPITAVEKAFERPLLLIEKDLQGYLRGTRFQGALLPMKLVKVEDDLPAAPAAAFEVTLTLTELTDRPGHEDATRQSLERLTRDDPKRPEPEAALGYLEWRQRDATAALPHFKKAFELGSHSSRFLWDYGRMAGGSDREMAVKALRTLVANEPNRNEARFTLASILLHDGRHEEALLAVAPVKKVSDTDAPKLFRILAYGQLKRGNREDARAAAERWQKYASEDEKPEADRMLAYLQAPPKGELVIPDERPRLVRPESADAPPSAPPAPATEEISGEFQRLLCDDGKLSVVLLTVHGRQTFLIADPKTVVISGAGGATVDLACGPQKKGAVRVEYGKPPAGTSDVDGVVLALHFGE